jgi:hypothetical protein
MSVLDRRHNLKPSPRAQTGDGLGPPTVLLDGGAEAAYERVEAVPAPRPVLAKGVSV